MPRTEPVVEAKRVAKKYCRNLKKSLWYGITDLASEFTGGSHESRKALRPGEFFAIRNISFKVEPGECIALLGPNGAGKSTMMKLLNGLLKPNAGEITIRGKIGALIELGTGFNPILTGKENVYINGSVLGMSRREIDERYEEILAFSELGEFIHAPVKTYSSGMRVRLGYSVAAHLQPDLLLLDEVLAVGDVGFRMKCFAHLAKLRDSGSAIILVSHAMGALSRVCDRAIVFGNGKLAFDGELEPGIATYQELVGIEKGLNQTEHTRPDSSICKIASVTVEDSAGNETRDFNTGDSLRLKIQLDAEQRLPNARVVLSIESPASGVLCNISSAAQEFLPTVDEPGRTIVFELPRLNFLIGSYYFNITLYGEENTDIHDQVSSVGSFRIIGPPLAPPGFGERGVIKLSHQWHDESVST